MTLSNQYLTYNEYVELGGEMAEMPFKLLEFEARTIVDNLTLGRLKNLTEQKEEVKLCIFKLIKSMSANGVNVNVASENTDGYTVTYRNNTEVNKQYNDIVSNYLWNCFLDDGTPYMYAGGF